MRGKKRLRMWARGLFAKGSVEQELDEEMRFHIDMEAAKHARAGLPPDEARRRASIAFGGIEDHKEAMRDGRGARGLERLASDLRFAARQLRKTPGFTAAAVLTLALGIGGNAAVFSVVNGVLLRPLAYPDADRIVSINHRSRGGDLPERVPHSSAAQVAYEGARSFEAMSLYSTRQGSLTDRQAAPEWVDLVVATRSLFDVLAVRPALGRVFTEEEDRPGGPRVAIISHALWSQRYGGDPAILGRAITLDGVPREVVGVMPEGFEFPGRASVMWIPMRIDREDLSGFNTPGLGRLRPGVTPEQATAELTQLLPRIVSVVDFIPPDVLRDTQLRPEVRPYLDEVVGNVRPALWALWAMIGLVLLIACVNVASLLLVRAESRRREIALRLALGADRHHLLAQSLTESGILLFLGGGLGILFAELTIRALPSIAPAALPRLGDVRIDGAVIAGTTLIAAVIAILFGVVPVARHRRVAPASMLGGSDRSGTTDRRSGRLRQMMVVAQVAMATILLVGSGLVLRSFQRLRAVDPGFRADSVMTFRIALPLARYEESQAVARFHSTMLDRIRALPGVEVAGATGLLPLSGYISLIDPLRVDGRPFPPGVMPPLVEMRVATPGYFEAMGIPLKDGRLLQRSDAEQRSGAVLVSEAVARKVVAPRQAIGARIAHGLGGVPGEREWSDVVGVVGDIRGVALDKEPMGAVYYAMMNREGVDMDWLARSMVYAVRTSLPPATLIASVRRTLAELDAELPLAETRTLASVVEAAEGGMRFSMLGLAVAALVGLFMGAIGLYGVLSYVTAQRTREIGVRMALGATPGTVRGSVLRHGLLVAGSGLGVGLLVAMSLRHLATPLLYGITPFDPLTLGAVSVVLLSVGALATWLPARRAARLDPVRALRWE
jgi:putative ABC transport system permease protein